MRRAAWAILLGAFSTASGQSRNGDYPRTLTEVRAMVQLLAAPKGGSAQEVYLARLRQHRFLCGVSYENLSWDAGQADLAYHASFICARLNQMTHTPSRPPGVTDEQYEKGRKGAGESNLFSGLVEPAACVDGWMDDSDPKNIDRVGHRRWCLNPSMGRSAFGAVGQYAAMYAFDRSNRDVPDWDYVAYPARGYMPTSFFGERIAWSVSPNTSKYRIPGQDKVKVVLQPVRPGSLSPAGEPLKLDYFKVDTGGYGSGPAIIFRPAGLKMANDAVYKVEIAGLADASGAPATISYVTHFVSPQRASGPEATAVYTTHFKGRFDAVQRLENAVDRMEALSELLGSEFAGQVEAATISAMKKEFAELLKDPAVKREHEAGRRYSLIHAAEQKAGQSKQKLLQAALGYRELAGGFKDTRAGARAAADFERLKAQLE